MVERSRIESFGAILTWCCRLVRLVVAVCRAGWRDADVEPADSTDVDLGFGGDACVRDDARGKPEL